jgi:putative Mg2+ transporter-C (MgtC) family protein
MTMPGVELFVRVGLATLLGLAIGIERQWRSRMAGLQTMALVSMGSALFLILGAYAFHRDVDPTRVAAQIVTGVGFLGAGLIMKQGSSVTGLNTAATLWATAAVGALAGAWAWREAVAGAGIIIVGNTFLHPLAARMDRLHFEAGRELPPVNYVVEVVCQGAAVDTVRASLIAAVSGSGFRLNSLSVRDTDTTNEVRLRADVWTAKRDDARVENAVRVLAAEPTVREVGWSIANQATADWTGRGAD